MTRDDNRNFYVYITASKPRGVLYVGLTAICRGGRQNIGIG